MEKWRNYFNAADSFVRKEENFIDSASSTSNAWQFGAIFNWVSWVILDFFDLALLRPLISPENPRNFLN